jgi:hypothetical protein
MVEGGLCNGRRIKAELAVFSVQRNMKKPQMSGEK